MNGLLEKTIYGGIALEPFEERALDLLVQRLWGRNVKKNWKMRLKLRYACLLAGGEIRRNPEAIGFGILLLLQQTEGAEQQFLARMQLCAVRKNALPDFRRKCAKTGVSRLING